MPTWDADQYLRFADHRMRPALDLISRLPEIPAGTIWDLGCGSGAITRTLADRWPGHHTVGIDSSASMLERAAEITGVEWMEADIASWDPPEPAALVFSNAALHWLPDHGTLFPRLVAALAPGGVLAVQMPRNFGEPSHRLLADLASSDEYTADLGHLVRPPPVAEPAWYHRLLSGDVSHLDLWETVYFQVLEGEDPVAQWTRGTGARPYLDALDADRAEEFFADYAAALAEAYPPRDDGRTLFPFRRLFMVAIR